MQAGDRIRDEQTHDERDDHAQAAHQDAVAEERPEPALHEDTEVGLERGGFGVERQVGLVELGLALQRGDEQPVERKRVHDPDDRENRHRDRGPPGAPTAPAHQRRSTGSSRVTSE